MQAEASPGFVAGDGAKAIASGTLAAGALAVTTGAQTLPPGAGSGAKEHQGPMWLAEVTFAIDPAQIPAGSTFTVTQTAGPVLTFTTAALANGFAIVPTAQPAANTLYAFGFHT